MQPRYFIGITLPNNLSQEVSRIQRGFFAPGKVMQPLVPHITLLDPNALATSSPDHIAEKAHSLAGHILPMRIKLSSVGSFDRRVLYIAVESEDLRVLHKQLVELLPEKMRASYYIGREFTPHLTLVQAKPSQELPLALIKDYQRAVNGLLPTTFTVTNLTQFTWKSPRNYRLKAI